MFEDNRDFIPRTYSIKGYKRRTALNFGKIFLYLIAFIIIVFILGVAFLSANSLV